MAAFGRRTFALLVAVAMFVASGCSSSETLSPPAAESAAVATPAAEPSPDPAPQGASLAETTTPVDSEAAPAATAAAAPDGAAAPARPAQREFGDDTGGTALADKQAAALKLSGDERDSAFRYFLDQARALRQENRFEQAERAAKSAVDLKPADAEADSLLRDIQELLGRSSSREYGMAEQAAAVEQARRGEAMREIRDEYAQGRKLFDNRNYRDAIRVLNHALDIANWFRYRIDTTGEQRQIRALIEEAKKRAQRQQIRDLEYSRELVEAMAELEKKQRVKRWRDEIESLYEAAKDQFDRAQYVEAEITLAKILWKDPYNTDVIRLKEYTRNLKYRRQNTKLKERMISMWQSLMNEIEDAQTPLVGEQFEAELPTFERWLEIEARARDVIARQTTPEDPEVRRIKDLLDAKTVPLTFSDTPLRDAINFLHGRSGVNIIPTSEVRDQWEDATVTIDIGNIKLGPALALVLDLAGGFKYWVESGAVWVGTEDDALGKGSITRIFNIKDLLGGYRNFPGEDFPLPGAATNAIPPPPPDEDEPTVIDPEELPDIIMAAVGGEDLWADPNSITPGPNGTLIAVNTPELLNGAADLLDDLRQSRGLMVSIESRFIEVQNNFLEELGIDYRGSGGIPPGAVGPNLTAAPLDDLQFGLNFVGLNQTTPIVGRDNSVGVYWNNAPDSEVRSHIEHFFDQALGDPDIMTRSGGASFQFAFLDDIQINAILRAVKKQERVTLVTAPKVTCFNTQRANITVRNQVAYISDFDVEAQQNVTIADPVISTVDDGIVLDMRPVISSDRRYITVEMQPTIALLRRPMDTLTTTLGTAGSTPVTIQLPEIQFQRVRTTVTVPDGGSFLLGGLRRTNDTQQESGVPLLSDIPIIGNFFKRQGRARLRSDLVIVIKARITDLRELVDMVAPEPGADRYAAGK